MQTALGSPLSLFGSPDAAPDLFPDNPRVQFQMLNIAFDESRRDQTMLASFEDAAHPCDADLSGRPPERVEHWEFIGRTSKHQRTVRQASWSFNAVSRLDDMPTKERREGLNGAKAHRRGVLAGRIVLTTDNWPSAIPHSDNGSVGAKSWRGCYRRVPYH